MSDHLLALHGRAAHAHHYPAHAAESFSAVQALTTLLTTETLLFAAFNLGIVLMAPVADGRRIGKIGAWRLVLAAWVGLCFVALAALLAWWQVFVDEWPGGGFRALEAIGIAIGITIQPLISLVVVLAIRPKAIGR